MLRQFTDASKATVDRAARAGTAAATVERSEQQSAAQLGWSTASWVDEQKPLCHVFAQALLRPLGDVTSSETPNEPAELAFIRSIGKEEPSVGREAILRLLGDGPFLARMAEQLYSAAASLAVQHSATARELQRKFIDESAFTLAYGGMDTFFGGLERLLGPPSPQLLEAMRREHCASADSKLYYTSSNYEVRTTSLIEWFFVVEPQEGKAKLSKHGQPITEWPTEQTLLAQAAQRKLRRENSNGSDPDSSRPGDGDADGAGSSADALDDDPIERMRVPKSIAFFEGDRFAIDEALKEKEVDLFGEAEFIGARLYTGPMYQKYNASLRGMEVPAMQKRWRDLCMGNRYTTTLHVINSAVVKLGKLQPATKVYRGIAGGVLPESFWTADEHNVRGGCEYGFLSTTTDVDVATDYAASDGRAAIVFEIQMGMVDRGASLSWLSQYPHEEEILFAPLTGVEMQSARVNGSVLVVDARVSVNYTNRTIEEVIAKMQSSALGLIDLMRDDLRHYGCPPRALEPLDDLYQLIDSQDADFYNKSDHYQDAVRDALETKKRVLHMLTLSSSWEDEHHARKSQSGGRLSHRGPNNTATLDVPGASPVRLVPAASPEKGGADIVTLPPLLKAPNGVATAARNATDAASHAATAAKKVGFQLLSPLAPPSKPAPVLGGKIPPPSHPAPILGAVSTIAVPPHRAPILGAVNAPRAPPPLPPQLQLLSSLSSRSLVSSASDDDNPRRSMAKRQLACAALAAREGEHADAAALLGLCVGSMEQLAAHVADEAAALRSDIVLRAAQRLDVRNVNAAVESERWRLAAARRLLAEGCMDPWPATFVHLATGGGPLLLRACAAMATRTLKVGKREPGVSVLAFDGDGQHWLRGTITRELHVSELQLDARQHAHLYAGTPQSDVDCGTLFEVRVTGDIDKLYAPPSRVLIPSAGGISALLREAASAGSDEFVGALLALGVGGYEVDPAGVTALHAAAAAGYVSVCQLLLDAGVDPHLDNARQVSAYEAAVQSRSNACRRLFVPDDFHADIQRALDELNTRAPAHADQPLSGNQPGIALLRAAALSVNNAEATNAVEMTLRHLLSKQPSSGGSTRLKLTVLADAHEKWGINWAGMVLAESGDGRPRIIYLPGERMYDPAGLTGDAHASERIGKACARTQAAITLAQLNALNVGASVEQLEQIQRATEKVIVRYHGRLTLWQYMFEQIVAAFERRDVTPYPTFIEERLASGELDGTLPERAHTRAFLQTWREGYPRPPPAYFSKVQQKDGADLEEGVNAWLSSTLATAEDPLCEVSKNASSEGGSSEAAGGVTSVRTGEPTNMVAGRLVPLGAPDGGTGVEIATAWEFPAFACSRSIDNVYRFDESSGRFDFDFTEFDTAYDETSPTAMRTTASFMVSGGSAALIAICNYRAQGGVTPLMLAARSGFPNCCKLLIEKRAHVDAQSESGCTALILAAAEGHETVVNELCKWCDISQIQAATYATNTTALMSAARFGHEALVGTLLDAKADPTRRLVDGRTVLFLASAAGYEGIVTQLIDALRSQGQLEAHVDVQREDGTSALIEASMYGHHETVQLLLDAEADVHVQNDNGDCALINACANGNEKSARMLLGAGARVDTCCALNNETALMAACRYGHLRVVRTLIALGAQVNAVDVRGNTALMHVCRYEQDDDDEMLRLLLQTGASVHVTAENGETALHIAAEMYHDEATAQLLKAKADPDTKRKDGETPLTIAAEKGFESILGMCLDAGASVEVTDSEGFTALHLAALHGHVEIVHRLLGAGALVKLQSSRPTTPGSQSSRPTTPGSPPNGAGVLATVATPIELAQLSDTPAHQQIVAELRAALHETKQQTRRRTRTKAKGERRPSVPKTKSSVSSFSGRSHSPSSRDEPANALPEDSIHTNGQADDSDSEDPS